MSNFSKVSVGISTKRYTHDMSFDNNTTLSFGVCQPLFCQLLNDKDKLAGNIRLLVRLAPLPVPSFGRMRLVNKLRFVQMTDICQYYEAMLSGSYVNTSDLNYLPKEVLQITIRSLTQIVLQYSVIDYFKVDSSSSTTKYVYQNISTPSVLNEAIGLYHTTVGGTSHFASIIPEPKPHFGNKDSAISPDSADYLVSTDTGFICFRLLKEVGVYVMFCWVLVMNLTFLVLIVFHLFLCLLILRLGMILMPHLVKLSGIKQMHLF